MLTQIIGTSGAAIILIAFIMTQLGKWSNKDTIYDVLNFLGSVLLVIYAIMLKSYPFLILNTIWGLVSLRDVIKKLSEK